MFGCAEKGSPAGERFHAAECCSLSLGERVRVRGKGALGLLRHVKTRGALSEILVALGVPACECDRRLAARSVPGCGGKASVASAGKLRRVVAAWLPRGGRVLIRLGPRVGREVGARLWLWCRYVVAMLWL